VDNEPEVQLVPCFIAPLPDAKELQAACEAEDIAAFLERDACCGKGGCNCAPKMQVLVAADDLPRVARLLEDRWQGLLAREGTIDDSAAPARPPAAADAEGEHPPCPACGTAAPLVSGACSDCGLQLE
jgi:hypothetical protein